MDLDLAILKTIITNKKYALEFANDCDTKILNNNYWRFANTIVEYVRIFKNVPTKRVILERSKLLKNENLIKYLEEIWNKVESFNYNDAEYKHDLAQLKTRYSKSLLSSLKDKLISDEAGDIKKSITEIQSTFQHIKGLDKIKAYEQKTLKENIDEFRNSYAARMNNPEIGKGIMTGYSFLDYTLNGLRKGELMIFGGESGSGKSLMLMNVGINMFLNGNSIYNENNFKKGHDILYFSLEMPYQDCESRVLSRLSMTSTKHIVNACLDEEESGRMASALKFLKNYPHEFEIVDMPRGLDVDSMEMIMNDTIAKRGSKPDVVIVDYLNLMSCVGAKEDGQDWLEQAKISEQLHEFGRVNDVVMLSAVQIATPKKEKIESDPGPSLLKRSKQIADNCNFICFIAPKRQNEQKYPDLTLSMIKSRRSELSSGKLLKNFECSAILDNYESSSDIDSNDISKIMND